MKSLSPNTLVKNDPFANATKQVNDACDVLGISIIMIEVHTREEFVTLILKVV